LNNCSQVMMPSKSRDPHSGVEDLNNLREVDTGARK
jgi:hypothetical protein